MHSDYDFPSGVSDGRQNTVTLLHPASQTDERLAQSGYGRREETRRIGGHRFDAFRRCIGRREREAFDKTVSETVKKSLRQESMANPM